MIHNTLHIVSTKPYLVNSKRGMVLDMKKLDKDMGCITKVKVLDDTRRYYVCKDQFNNLMFITQNNIYFIDERVVSSINFNDLFDIIRPIEGHELDTILESHDTLTVKR